MKFRAAHTTAPWKAVVDRYTRSDTRRAIWQIANTFIPYTAVWVLMVLSLQVSYWLTLPLAVVAAAFLVRIFIIHHDCGHGSFLASKRANDCIGFISGLLTLTPYFYWRHTHAIHHATAGNLDRRGVGDIWTMTVREYQAASRWERIKFRVYRNPLVLFVIGPFFLFVFSNRFANFKAGMRWHLSVLWTNLALVALVALGVLLVGWKTLLLVQLPVLVFSCIGGVWLFYVQHQFEGVYWSRQQDWDYVQVALAGSSHYALPPLLQWFSGNIGFHHIHHLNPRIPNYFLDRAHRDSPAFQKVRALRFW